jgi:type II secretory pathway component PulF
MGQKTWCPPSSSFLENQGVDLGTLVALVDAIMIACMAVVVGIVLVAFYLPLFSMAAQIH